MKKRLLLFALTLSMLFTAGCAPVGAATDATGVLAGDGNEVYQITQITKDSNGYIILSDLPTSDPGVPGALYIDNGTLKVSP